MTPGDPRSCSTQTGQPRNQPHMSLRRLGGWVAGNPIETSGGRLAGVHYRLERATATSGSESMRPSQRPGLEGGASGGDPPPPVTAPAGVTSTDPPSASSL